MSEKPASAEAPQDDAEQARAILDKAAGIIATAPDVAGPERIEHPESLGFEIVRREVNVGGTAGQTITLTPGAAEGGIREGVVLDSDGGTLVRSEGYAMPSKGAENQYGRLVEQLRGTTPDNGRLTTIARRSMLVGGVPAMASLELEQLPDGNGGLAVRVATIAVDRKLPDGSTFRQETVVRDPRPMVPGFYDKDSLYRASGTLAERNDEARRVAAEQLPADPMLPFEPMGYEQCAYVLGE